MKPSMTSEAVPTIPAGQRGFGGLAVLLPFVLIDECLMLTPAFVSRGMRIAASDRYGFTRAGTKPPIVARFCSTAAWVLRRRAPDGRPAARQRPRTSP
jgi:hypothetical protein